MTDIETRLKTARDVWGEFGFWTDGEFGRGGGEYVTVAQVLDDISSEKHVSVYEWEKRDDGYLHLVRTKTIREVYNELCAILGEYPAGGEEYFSVVEEEDEEEWPAGEIVCFSVNGSSEGDYTHVEVHGDGVRRLLFLGKTFDGRDTSWAFARRLADLLEIQ